MFFRPASTAVKARLEPIKTEIKAEEPRLVELHQSAKDIYVPMKDGLSEDQQEKVKKVYTLARSEGMTIEQSTIVLGLIDHESAGTWDENVKGDNGCSKGIAQWNKCVGRVAPKTFEEQAQKIVDEMAEKFSKHNIRKAISLHNAPGYKGEMTVYVNKVLKSTSLFK